MITWFNLIVIRINELNKLAPNTSKLNLRLLNKFLNIISRYYSDLKRNSKLKLE